MTARQPPPELNLAQLLRIPFQALVTELHRRLADAGYGDIRPTHTAVFAHLDERGMRLGELAERAQLSKQLTNYLITALEQLGYVERVPDPSDGRARIVRLTARGVRASQIGRELIDGIEAEWAAQLGEQRHASLRAALEQLVPLLTAPAAPAAATDHGLDNEEAAVDGTRLA
jgi:DNA-binding MarR family transcriptional regulator